ncbi:hypothetical protein Bca4012_068975 [Brassica carinata]
MLRRQRPGGGRHPPPLTPTVSNFKPRAQWNNSGSSILLYVNLPGFYRDQIEIKKDEKTRAIYIQGQRPLSTHTKARFNEVYRVPESCDMTKLNTSFSHGILTIEFPAVVEGEKMENAAHNEENRGTSLNGSSLGRKKVAPVVNKEEPKTYKSVLEGKKAIPAANKVKTEEKVKEGEASSSSGRKDNSGQEKVVEKKEAAQVGQQKSVQKIKEEEARNTLTVRGSLKAKILAIEEKALERKKEADMGQKKTEEKVKEEGSTRTPIIGGSLERKVHFNEEKVERKGDGEISQKLKEEGKSGLGENKEKNHTKPVVGDEARRTNKEVSGTNQAKHELKTKERVERIAQDVNGNVISKHDKKDEKMVGYKVSEGEIQEKVEEKKVKEAGLVMQPRRVDSDVKEETAKGGEDREKMVEKISESEKDTLLVEEQRKTIMDTHATEGRPHEEEGSQKYDTSLVNVGVASLVIMGCLQQISLLKNYHE